MPTAGADAALGRGARRAGLAREPGADRAPGSRSRRSRTRGTEPLRGRVPDRPDGRDGRRALAPLRHAAAHGARRRGGRAEHRAAVVRQRQDRPAAHARGPHRRRSTGCSRSGGRAGSTLNDVALTVVAGALRRLALAEGQGREPLKVMVPVSRRSGPEAAEPGNRIAFVFVALPRAPRAPARAPRGGALGDAGLQGRRAGGRRRRALLGALGASPGRCRRARRGWPPRRGCTTSWSPTSRGRASRSTCWAPSASRRAGHPAQRGPRPVDRRLLAARLDHASRATRPGRAALRGRPARGALEDSVAELSRRGAPRRPTLSARAA